jgi:hypothetical protein
MGKNRACRWAAAVTAILLLLGSALAVAPRWINLEPVKTRILETASRSLGARIAYGRLDLILVPRPRIVAHDVRVHIPGQVDGTVDTLEVAPAIFPLLRGNIRVARVRAVVPDFSITLSSREAGKEKPTTLPELRARATRLLSALASATPGAVFELSRGRITLIGLGSPPLSLTDLSARIDAPPDVLRATVSCAAPLWERLTAKVRLDPDGLKADGTLRITRLAADRLASFVPPRAGIAWAGATPDLEVEFGSEGLRTLKADFKAVIPAVSLRRAAGRAPLAARDVRMSGSVRLDPEALALTEIRLSAGAPPLKASGEFRLALPSSRASLAIRAENVDVAAVSRALLGFAGDVAPLPDVFGWLRGGTVSSLAIASDAASPGGLGALDAIRLRGRLVDGRLRVPPAKLDLEAVRGTVSMTRGVLTASGVSARLGNSRAAEASVAIDFGRPGVPFRVDAPVRADLSQLPGVMGRLPLPADAAAFLAGIGSIEGSAAGRLSIEGDGASVRTAVTAREIRLTGRHAKIPFPVSVSGGTFTLSGDTIRIGDAAGAVGRTKFAALEGRLQVAGEYPVDHVSGRVEADLGELLGWPGAAAAVANATGGITPTGGTVDLALAALEGPLRRPQALRFEGAGAFRDIGLEGGRLPGPLALHAGKFRASPDALSLESFRGALLDAELHGSAAWSGLRSDKRRIEASGVGGTLGPDAVRRLGTLGKLPAGFTLPAPMTLADVRFSHDESAVSLAGTFSARDGTVVGLDLSIRPGALEIRSASLRDADSDAAFSLTRVPESLGFRFSGRLAAASIGRLFPGRAPGKAWLSGDFRILVPHGDAPRLTANGTLEARELTFPELLGPLAVSRLSLSASDDRLSVHSADFAWEGRPFALEGTLVNGTGGVTADLSLKAADLSVEAVDRALARIGPDPAAGGNGWRLPLAGSIRVTAERFAWGKFTWAPLRADVRIDPREVSGVVREATLCGISTPGSFRITPGGTTVDFRAAASGQPIDAALACLGEKEFRMTGTYSLDARVRGEGRGEALAHSLKGPVSFEARNGRIHRANVLMKVLALLNVTQLLVGKVPDLAESGFAYNSLKFSGTVGDGRLKIPDLVLDAASANVAAEGTVDLRRREVDGVLLASPFKTVDTVIRAIPVLRYIMKGRLVAVPFGVRGPVGDPGVSPHPPPEVGAGLLGVVERTLKLPVKLIAPMLPKETEKGAGAAPR